MHDVKYANQPNTDNGPSPSVWRGCPWTVAQEDPRIGLSYRDQFMSYVADTVGWKSVGTNPITVATQAAEQTGVIRIGATGADNDEAYLIQGNNVSGFLKPAATKSIWFEARVRFNQVADQGVFVGLLKCATAAAELLADNTGAPVATMDGIGFHCLTASPTRLDAIYQATGQTKKVVKQGAHTIVAASWVKLGIRLDDEGLRYFVNGVPANIPQTADVQTILFGAGITTPATFPVVIMAPCFGIKTGEAVAKNMDIDWVQTFQRLTVGD